jgi:hypothetical protein
METMRLVKLTTLIALSALLLMSLPAFADSSFTTYAQPTPGGYYVTNTTNYGGGDGSGGTIFSLGPYSFSSGMTESSVPNTWATWGCPPATESCTPNVLYSNGATSLTITLTAEINIAGFELEPDQFQQEEVRVDYYATDLTTILGTVDLFPNGSNGALLFAASDNNAFGKIVITDLAGDDFAIAQDRGAYVPPSTPEPGTMVLLGTGLLGALGVMRRKMNL